MRRALLVLVAGAAVFFVGSVSDLAAQEGPDTVVFTRARLGTVTFPHAAHAEANECSSCHHESKPERPLEAEQQACSDCHMEEAPEGMTTTIDMIFHADRAASGLCVDCHATAAENGTEVPSRCRDCHVRDAGQQESELPALVQWFLKR